MAKIIYMHLRHAGSVQGGNTLVPHHARDSTRFQLNRRKSVLTLRHPEYIILITDTRCSRQRKEGASADKLQVKLAKSYPLLDSKDFCSKC